MGRSRGSSGCGRGCAVSVGELDGWDLVASPPARRPRRRRGRSAGAVGVALVVGYAVWSLVAIHDGGPVRWEPTGHASACATNPLDEPGDLTVTLGLGTFGEYRPLGARLVGAHGLSLVEADVTALRLGPGGDGGRPPVAAGWPSFGGAVASSAGLVPLAGATITGPPQVLVLHLHVDEPRAEVGFRDVGVVYRAGLFRYERLLDASQRLVPAGTACA